MKKLSKHENNYNKSISELKKINGFVNIKTPKKAQMWTKVLFASMTVELARIFYDTKIKRQEHHTLFYGTPIRIGNEKIFCNECGMRGHNHKQCNEGLKEIVRTHGPNLRANNTFVANPNAFQNEREYHPNTKNFLLFYQTQ